MVVAAMEPVEPSLQPPVPCLGDRQVAGRVSPAQGGLDSRR